MPGDKTFYITTAISYPNGAPHIGHAYEALSTDVLARFKRLDGYDVFFLTGTDEHGQKMVETAEKEGITPAELADRNTPMFKKLAAALGCSNDDFITTREERHVKASQEIWRRLAAKGDIYLGKYEGWYSVRDEAFYTETELTEGPNGEKLAPTGTEVKWMEEESYFFKLSAYQDKLMELYESQPGFVQPDARRNEIMSFVKGGLKDLSVSRKTLKWGVPVPGDDDHVMYVWIDALTNYITGVGFPDTDEEAFNKYWPADLHIIGKDILRFHTVYWPAFLMSADVPLPKRVFAHGFLYNRGEKMSKSLGNVLDPFEMIDKYGVDPFRYFFCREVPYGQDGSYGHEAMVNRINADLANDLGNLAQRSLSMIAKNCDGKVPQPGALTEDDTAMLAAVDGLLEPARAAMDEQAIHTYAGDVWKVVAEANRYFAGHEPWALKKTDPERMGTVLYVTAEIIRQIAILAAPIMPASCARLLDLVVIPEADRTFAALGEGGRLAPGTELPKPEGVFPRYVEEEKAE
ncbi:methionine--tRNA ligase [Pyruvatibacter mobilis]|uniref:methionine--tRNA ligase n=1 Tax=Pyruvatibacter mobilis TaxID=1712261 RepID=UPI003BAA95CF